MNQNLVGSIRERSSIKIAHLVLICLQTWPQVLVIWLNSYKEEDIYKSTNQKQEWPVVAMFIDESELNKQSL
jgi:hypothetical protein